MMNALDMCDKGRGIFDSHHEKPLRASSVAVASLGTLSINVELHHYYSLNSEAISLIVVTIRLFIDPVGTWSLKLVMASIAYDIVLCVPLCLFFFALYHPSRNNYLCVPVPWSHGKFR